MTVYSHWINLRTASSIEQLADMETRACNYAQAKFGYCHTSVARDYVNMLRNEAKRVRAVLELMNWARETQPA